MSTPTATASSRAAQGVKVFSHSGKSAAKKMNVTTVQPPAGMGSPTKKRLPVTAVLTLKRASRSAPPAA